MEYSKTILFYNSKSVLYGAAVAVKGLAGMLSIILANLYCICKMQTWNLNSN